MTIAWLLFATCLATAVSCLTFYKFVKFMNDIDETLDFGILLILSILNWIIVGKFYYILQGY